MSDTATDEGELHAYGRSGFRPDPENPGWFKRPPSIGGFAEIFGAMLVRLEGERLVRCRFEAGEQHANHYRFLHGGYLMAAIDQGMFMIAAARKATGEHGAVTLNCSTSFIAPGQLGAPLEVVGEVLRESKRLVFLRGLVEQDGRTVASFSGTLNKVSPRS